MEKRGVSFAKHARIDFRERSTALIHTQPSPRQGQILRSKVLVEISSISAKIVFLVVSFACAKERHNKVESSAKFSMKEAFSLWMVFFPFFHSCQKINRQAGGVRGGRKKTGASLCRPHYLPTSSVLLLSLASARAFFRRKNCIHDGY